MTCSWVNKALCLLAKCAEYNAVICILRELKSANPEKLGLPRNQLFHQINNEKLFSLSLKNISFLWVSFLGNPPKSNLDLKNWCLMVLVTDCAREHSLGGILRKAFTWSIPQVAEIIFSLVPPKLPFSAPLHQGQIVPFVGCALCKSTLIF